MDTTIDYRDVRNARELISRTPNGTQVLEVAVALGLVNSAMVNTPAERKSLKPNVSALSPAALSNEQSYWASEFGRIVELSGVLVGQEQYLSLQAKSARARARARLLREAVEASNTAAQAEADQLDAAIAADPDAFKKTKVVKAKSITATQIADIAESDAAVLDADETLSLVKLMLEVAKASEKATAMYLQVLSREISFRTAQMEARIY